MWDGLPPHLSLLVPDCGSGNGTEAAQRVRPPRQDVKWCCHRFASYGEKRRPPQQRRCSAGSPLRPSPKRQRPPRKQRKGSRATRARWTLSQSSGALGRLIGFGPESGVRLGGVLVSNGNYLASGGNNPGVASFNDLFVTALDADLDKLVHIPGAMVGAALLRFDGQTTNQQAGVVTGYNSLPGAPPLDRTELYELWWRQSLFADSVVVRFGKLVAN